MVLGVAVGDGNDVWRVLACWLFFLTPLISPALPLLLSLPASSHVYHDHHYLHRHHQSLGKEASRVMAKLVNKHALSG